MSEKALAILCSDLHLSHTAPVARSPEPDWYGVMVGYLDELKAIQGAHGNCPIVIAGDIFDKWNPTPELINFAIQNMPDQVYSVPGQHDLPYHRYSEMERSAYGTLVASDVIRDLTPGLIYWPPSRGSLIMQGFPWGSDLKPLCVERKPNTIYLAVVHRYCWKEGNAHPGARKEDKVFELLDKLTGFDLAVFGDNHIPHLSINSEARWAYNCGGFMRRNRDQMNHEPEVGVLFEGGRVKRHKLEHWKTADEKWLENDEETVKSFEKGAEMADFVQTLDSLEHAEDDFVAVVLHALRNGKIRKEVREVVMKALEQK